MRYALVVRKTAILDLEADGLLIPTTRDLVVGGNFGLALSRAAGPEFQAACRRIAPVELGGAAVTPAGDLKALIVIHAACISLGQTTKMLLERSYVRGLELAEQSGIQSVATPAFAIPAAGMKMEETTALLVRLMKEALDRGTVIQQVVFAVPNVDMFQAYSEACAAETPEDETAEDEE